MNNLTLSRAINVNNKYYKKNTILESAIVTLICIKKKTKYAIFYRWHIQD